MSEPSPRRPIFQPSKRSKDDKEWFIAYSGLQPTDTLKINTDFKFYKNDFVDFTNEVYNVANVKESQQLLVKKCLYALRESSSQFYGKYNDDDQDTEAVEEVKSGGRD